jgi:hypothetical protein
MGERADWLSKESILDSISGLVVGVTLSLLADCL